jgi:hypothetical protein
MKREKIFLSRIALSTALGLLLIFGIGCQQKPPPEKVQVPTYPSLRESFDQDFQHALETALKKEFQGEYKRAVENKKAAFVVVNLTNLQQPRVAGINPDVMMYAASLPKIAILLGAFVKIERGEILLDDETRSELHPHDPKIVQRGRHRHPQSCGFRRFGRNSKIPKIPSLRSGT